IFTFHLKGLLIFSPKVPNRFRVDFSKFALTIIYNDGIFYFPRLNFNFFGGLMKKIILTGGGTAGHVTPNLALIPSLKALDYEIRYIGSYQGIEKRLIENAGIPYDGISSGKLRRYLDVKNFSDPFRVLKGYAQA